MAKYFLLFQVLLFLPIFSDWDDDNRKYASYHEIPNLITYGGMSMECHWGCGDPEEDPSAAEISSMLEETTHKIFLCCSPLYMGWAGLNEFNAYPFCAWDYNGTECSTYDWQTSRGFYLQENPRKSYTIATYAQFLEMASALRRDLQFYYLDVYAQELDLYCSTLPRLQKEQKRGEHGSVQFNQIGQLEFFDYGTYTGKNKEIPEFIKHLKEEIHRLKKNLLEYYPKECEKKKELLEKAIQNMDAKFRDIFAWCLEHHQPEGIAFHAALESFLGEDFDLAIEKIRWLIKTAEKLHAEDDLISKLYFLKGQVQLEFGLYAEAIICLTTSIQKNPSMKEAYFERATAYFELGRFDLAIEDFLSSNIHSRSIVSPTQLGLGITTGILRGTSESAMGFIPSVISTLRGIGNGLWALTKDPVAMSLEFANAAIQCIEYIKSHSTDAIIQDMVPELKELLQTYEQLDDFEKGKLIGHVIGKYGLDIFLAKQGVSFIKSYRELKQANHLMTLEALSSSQHNFKILEEAGKRWTLRESVLKNGVLKIHEGRQNKHIFKYMKQGDTRSILTYPDPQNS